jgi:magnesium-transporting ATPase (P-type)
MTGHGKAIVCAVGANTLLARIRGNQEFKIMESSTHLDCKLDSTAKQIGKYALLVMAAYILTSIVF